MEQQGFLANQHLDMEDDRNLRVVNTMDVTDLLNENAKERNESQSGKNMKHLCSIPVFEFNRDPLLKQYLFYCEQHDGDNARKKLRQFLALNPQYRTTDDRF